MSLLNDWKDFCIVNKKNDYTHFYTLFHEEYTEEELDEVFNFFYVKEKLKKRFLEYKEPFKSITDKDLLELVKIDLNEKREFCKKMKDQELESILNRVSFSFIDESEFNKRKKEDIPHHWLMELIGDHMISIRDDSMKTIALLEAFYGLTSDYNNVWFLGNPLYNSSYFNPDYYFDVWINSGEYLITNENVLILNKSSLNY